MPIALELTKGTLGLNLKNDKDLEEVKAAFTSRNADKLVTKPFG